MRQFLLVCFFVVFSTGCAPQAQRIKDTASGLPEVEIFSTDRHGIKSAFINRMVQRKWVLEQEGDSYLLFTQVDTSGSIESAFTQMLIGNSYSTPPKYEVRYVFTSIGNRTKVFVNTAVSAQMAGGQVNRVSIDENNSLFNSIQNQLDLVKSEIESRK